MVATRRRNRAGILLLLGLCALLLENPAETVPRPGGALRRIGDVAPYKVADPRAPRPIALARGRARYALLISIDGLSYPTLKRFLPRLPQLRRLAARGLAGPMETVFPSMTWAAHVSIHTGQYPRFHGVLANRWLSSSRGMVKPYYGVFPSDVDRGRRTPSLYDLAARRGWATAAINWPGTQGASTIRYNLPETMSVGAKRAYRLLSPALREVYLRLYRKRRRRSARWRRLGPSWALANVLVREDLSTDRLVRDLTLQLLRKRRKIPRLMMVHLVAPDTWMHSHDPRSAAVLKVLRKTDRLVGEIVRAYERARIADKTATLVFSDHGFARLSHRFDIRRALVSAGLARYRWLKDERIQLADVATISNGQAVFIYLKQGNRAKLVRIARLLKEKRFAGCVEAVYGPRQLARLGLPLPLSLSSDDEDAGGEETRGHHPDAPALVALLRPRCALGNGRWVIRRAAHVGAHGYLPNHPQLRAFLIASGAGIRRRSAALPLCRAVDIAPTTAQLLGLSWPRTWPGSREPFLLDGRVLKLALK